MDSLVLDYSINPDDAARIMAELEERYRYFISILLSPRHRPSVLPKHPCEHSRINILQWILTKHGTYLVLKRIWNAIDFQGQRSRSPGQILGEEIRHALPLLSPRQRSCEGI